MKKNKMMRLASLLLVCVLLTTSVISGTFAKYVTTNGGEDKAQVAKFGVVITVADDMELFDTKYDTHDSTDYKGALSVESNTSVGDNSDNRVAPGTDGFMTFNISGIPEVATKLTVTVEGNPIKLDASTYELPAGEFANVVTSVTTTAVYEPIKFYFGEGTSVPTDATYTLTLADLESTMEALTTTFAPNQDLEKDYVIAWKWAFQNDFTAGEFAAVPYTDAKVVDFLDTFLGNEDPLQVETLKINITVEQVD